MQENRAAKQARGKVCKDWGLFPNLYEYPLACFAALFFNTVNPLTERLQTEIRIKKKSDIRVATVIFAKTSNRKKTVAFSNIY